jgi:hypothetical protein
MIERASRDFGFHPQRSFWLRCFLDFSCLLFVAWLGTVEARAQISVDPPYHVAHLRGLFVDAKGNPIPDAEVTLDRGDKAIYSTHTDGSGKFAIKHVSGRYGLRVQKKGYAKLNRQVIVGLEAETYLRGSTLYMIAGPGACMDDCSSVFTSKSKFKQAIREYTERFNEANSK